MHRQQLEHIIRAAADITGASEFVIVGSQAVLGQFPQAPDELLVSIEADVFSLRDPADNDLIDGSIGEGSPFHQTFGYYPCSQCVAPCRSQDQSSRLGSTPDARPPRNPGSTGTKS